MRILKIVAMLLIMVLCNPHRIIILAASVFSYALERSGEIWCNTGHMLRVWANKAAIGWPVFNEKMSEKIIAEIEAYRNKK